ncbi:MAG: ArnT family glycosyltransferase [Anaerolineales bacterium]
MEKHNNLSLSIPTSKILEKWRWIFFGLISDVLLSILLADCSNHFTNLNGWGNFFFSILFAELLLWGGWLLIAKEKPPAWLAKLLLGAALLRLLLGAVWFVALPTAGYGTMAERNGYIMADAYNRDRSAWRVANSSAPLSSILTIRSYRKVDQYSGFLLLSSLYYRVFDGQAHYPLMMIVLTASFSALAVLFTWALTRQAFGESPAKLAAWGIALYPEAVLLGSSQMREAFLIPLISLSFYGLIHLLKDHSWRSALITFAAMLLTLPFSPPATALLLASLVVVGLFGGNIALLRQKRLWIAISSVTGLVLLGVWYAWRDYAPQSKHNVFSVAAWWFKISAGMQAHLSILNSGLVQHILKTLPSWMHFPFLTLYGVLRPLLPAALADALGKPFWQIISIWRALGWTILLAFLIVAPIMAFRKMQAEDQQPIYLARAFSLVVWGAILIASMRAGADLWDNPRYRAMFSSLQIALAAWVWVRYREHHDPWLKHIVISLGLVLIWFIPWYLRRYFPLSWPLSDFFHTVIAGVLSVIIYALYQIFRKKPSS